MLESKLEARLRTKLKKIGCMCLKFQSPSMNGVPDRMVLASGGRIYFVELKAPGEKPRPDQLVVHEMFVSLGHPVYVVDSVDFVDALVEHIHEEGG